jgi:hypothetical protein
MARYLDKHKVLFQHIPRTGGTWVEKALTAMDVKAGRWVEKQEPWLPRKHSLLGHYFRKDMATVNYVVTFVRHPETLYPSVWNWLKAQTPKKRRSIVERWRWHPKRRAAELYQPVFDDWVFLMLRHEPGWVTRLYENYCGPPGGEYCDYIGRTESLIGDFCTAMAMVGYGQEITQWSLEIYDLPPQNVSKERVKWNSGLLSDVLFVERLCIERFYGEETKIRRLYHGLVPTEG